MRCAIALTVVCISTDMILKDSFWNKWFNLARKNPKFQYQLTIRNSWPCGHSSFWNDVRATDNNASLGHSVNQSIVQQLTSDGNMRHLDRNESPTGLIHSTTCKLFRTRLIKKLNIESRSPSGMPVSLAAVRHPFIMRSRSSASNRFGTSPLFRILLMSSRNSSTTILLENLG